MGHAHLVKDTDVYFEIDAITRKIQAKSGKSALIQGDHNSEKFTFRMPRWIEEHDMVQCNSVQVHFMNVDSSKKAQSKDIYEVDDLRVDTEDEDYISLTWLISNNATKYAGRLSFLIKFKCVTDGVVEYVWNTAIYTDISIYEGMDNGEAIAEEYSDILEQLKSKIEALAIGGGSARVAYVDLLTEGWAGEASPYSQIVSIDGTTKRSQVYLTPSVEQLAIFHEKDIAFVTENDDGTIIVYAIGQKPTNDYTMQVTITEVIV